MNSLYGMSKGDLMDLANKYGLYESERDFLNFTYALDFDNLADFICFLFTGDWSRNIYVLEKEIREDEEVKDLFEYVEERFKWLQFLQTKKQDK